MTHRRGEEQRAGVMNATAMLPDGAAGHRSVCFATGDTDAPLDLAV